MGYTRYRLKSIPGKLAYRDGAVAIEIVKRRHPAMPLDVWMLQARKIADGAGDPLVLTFDIIGHRHGLEAKLRHEFSVSHETPAEKIMQRLVREGHAEIVTGRNPHRWH